MWLDRKWWVLFLFWDYSGRTIKPAPGTIYSTLPLQNQNKADILTVSMTNNTTFLQYVSNLRCFNQKNEDNTNSTNALHSTTGEPAAPFSRLILLPDVRFRNVQSIAQVFVYIIRNHILSQSRGLCGLDKDHGYLLHPAEPFQWVFDNNKVAHTREDFWILVFTLPMSFA